MPQLRTFSYGGGVQSTAALVLAAQGRIDFPVFLFANVGDDSEHPATLAYVEKYSKPYAAAQGIELVELRYDGPTLYETLTTTARDCIPWQIEMTRSEKRYGDAMPLSRTCTAEWKIKVIAAEQRRRGASKEQPAITGLGISLDEIERMKTESGIACQALTYPLIDLRLARDACGRIILDAGLPLPPKSACWFCPHRKLATWAQMRRDQPDLFARLRNSKSRSGRHE